MKTSLLITHRINYLATLINKEAEKILESHFQILYSEYVIGVFIHEKMQTDQVSLCHASGLSKGAVSKIAQSLSKKKIISIKENKDCARTNILSLTKHGNNIIENASLVLENAFIRFLESFESKQSMKEFNQQLKLIIDKLTIK